MQKLLLEFGNVDDAQLIKEDFERELPYEIVTSSRPEETHNLLSNTSIQLVIYQTQSFKEPQIRRIQELRRIGYSYPVLIIVDRSSPLSEQFATTDARVTFLEKPFELRALRGLTRKLITTRSVHKQRFPRYRTNQKVALENFASGEHVETKMFNLSKGGAYFEVEQKPGLGVGELLRLKFQLDQLEKEHQIHGRIVWTTPKGHIGGGYGIGVKFIKLEDIYRHLLQTV